MTNKEPKEKAIREAWGDLYDHAVVDDNGWAGASPKFMAGGEWLIEVDSVDDGFGCRPKALRGIENNNGWNRIDGPDTLPSTRGEYTVLGKSGKIEEWTFTGGSQNIDFWLEYFTHWRQVVELPKPIY